MKKIAIFTIVFICLLLLFTILIDSIPVDMHGELEWIETSDSESPILSYREKSYYQADQRYQVRTSDGDDVVELGWYSQFPFFPDMHFYTFNEEPTLFIFCDNEKSTLYNTGLYVTMDYDLYNAIYTIENTNIEISLNSAMTKSEVEPSLIDHDGFQHICLKLKDDSRIQAYVSGPYKYNDNWYVISAGESWLLSDDFVLSLKEHNII